MITGAVWSFTVIVCVQVLELPHTSVIVYVLVIVNLFTHDPAVVASDDVTLSVPPQASLAAPPAALKPAISVAATGTDVAHETVTAVAHVVMAGPVWSLTVIVCVQLLELPATSVAVHVLVIT